MKTRPIFVLLIVCATLTTALTAGFVCAQTKSAPPAERKRNKTVKTQDVFMLLTTDKMTECRDFYVRHFGCEVAFETTIYLQLTVPSESGHPFSIAFMPPDHPFGVVGPEPFSGKGLMLTIKVADSRKVYEKLKAEGAPIVHPLTDEAWGQRRFDTRDPAGVTIDVVEDIDAAPGYYDKYQVKPAAHSAH